MASASVLTYPAIPQPYAHFGEYHNGAVTVSPSSSPVAQNFPYYASQPPSLGGAGGGAYIPHVSSGAIAAAQAAGGTIKPSQLGSRKSRNSPKRRSFGRAATTSTDAALDTIRSTTSRTTAKEKLKTNIKKAAHQRDDPPTTLDLSLTAEENERRTGIPLMISSRARAATDVPFVSVSRKRNNTTGGGAPDVSFKPTSPLVLPTHPGSRPATSHSTHHSHANSLANSEYSTDWLDGYRKTSAPVSERPSLRVNTSEADSIRLNARRRRNTNQSSASATTPPSIPKKSFDRALSIITRQDSNATDDMMDPATRTASIRAARQAFEEREEKKDAKYQKRAAKDRERQEQKEKRKQNSVRSRAESNAPKTSSNLHLTEKVDDTPHPVQGKAYDDLPIPHPSARPRMGGSMLPDIPKFSRKRHMKNRYASFLSWLKTKFLNLGRRRRTA